MRFLLSHGTVLRNVKSVLILLLAKFAVYMGYFSCGTFSYNSTPHDLFPDLLKH